MSEATSPAPQDYGTYQRRAVIVGGVALVLAIIGAFLDPVHFFRAYLQAYIFWAGIALGCLALALLHRLAGGSWGLAVRRMLEAGARTLLPMALLFIPLIFGLPFLYEWAVPEIVAQDPILQAKQPYLNVPFFLIRTLFYFLVWIGIAYLLTSWTRNEDEVIDPVIVRRLRTFSGLGLVLFVLTVTFAAYDWLMSLEAHWFSSVFGALVGAGHVLTAFAFIVLVAAILVGREPLLRAISPALFNDLGSLMLAFVMIWAYLHLSQFLIIWSGNIPEGVTWYLHRSYGAWRFVPVFLAIFHFAVPFVLLMARSIRRSPRRLASVAGFLMVVHFVYLVWLVAPSPQFHGIFAHWLDPLALVALGGLWVALFIWQLKQRPLLPLLEIATIRERMEHVGHD
jgi:hypothetical protein